MVLLPGDGALKFDVPRIEIHPPTPTPPPVTPKAAIVSEGEEASKLPLIDLSTEKTVFDENVEDLDSNVTALISKHFSKKPYKDEGDKVRKEVMRTVAVVSHSLYKRGYTFNDMVQRLERFNFYVDLNAMKELIVNYPTRREQEIIKLGRHNAAYMLCMAIDGQSEYVFNLVKLFVSTHDLIGKVRVIEEICGKASRTYAIIKGPEVAMLLQTALKVANAATAAKHGLGTFKATHLALSELPDLLAVQAKAGETETATLADFVASLLPYSEKQLEDVRESMRGFSNSRKKLLEVPKLIENIRRVQNQQTYLGNEDVQRFYILFREHQLEGCEYMEKLHFRLLESEESVKSTIGAEMNKTLAEAAELLVLSLDMVLASKKDNRFGSLVSKPFMARKIYTNLDSTIKNEKNGENLPSKRGERRNRLSSKHRPNSDKPKSRFLSHRPQNEVDDANIETVSTDEGGSPSVPGPASHNVWRRMRGFFRDKVRTLQAEYEGMRDYLRWRRHLL
ncbi:unnamed protein product [Caenorhabditis brenneri]